jgi:exopolyphosphatase/guanosine-5'-triphosphate,3'-diphosphate pyrophosphatase
VPKKRTPSLPRTAIVDIGSNTVRLVVYDGIASLAAPLFNEKATCALARGLADTGRLNPEGRDNAMVALARFVRLARAMRVGRIRALATAAVREAEDGASFVARIERRFRIPVRVLSGPEEAHYSAFGLLASVPQADGLLGDLGGGSLELVALERGQIRRSASLMLGHLVLAERTDGSRKRAREVIDRELGAISWLGRLKGRSLYVTGGAWRAIAHILLGQTKHPLHIIDGYEIEAGEVSRIAAILSDLSRETLLKIEKLSPRRAETLSFAALVLRALIEKGRPESVVFSGYGIREGAFISALPERPAKERDLLVEGAAAIARRTGRFSLDGEEICRWLDPLFRSLARDRKGRERKLRLVVGYLSDVARFDHPDYRAEHALTRVLRLPLGGLTHADRAFAALAVFVRYGGAIDSATARPYAGLLDDERLHSANVLGLALRLAYALSGGAPGLLTRTRLNIADDALVLKLPRARAAYAGETVDRRLRALARALELEPRLR